jgi:hypothetical protein
MGDRARASPRREVAVSRVNAGGRAVLLGDGLEQGSQLDALRRVQRDT